MGMDLAEVVFDATSDLECGLTARPEGTNDCSRKTRGSLLAALVAALITGCGGAEPDVESPLVRSIKMMEIASRSAGRRLEYPGRVSPIVESELSFEVPGRISYFPVKEGQWLEEGEVIARVDDHNFRAEVTSFQARLNSAQADYDRFSALLADGAVSQRDLETRRRNYEVAQSNLAIAEKALEDTELRAHFAGRVARKLASDFQNVLAKEPVVLLQDDRVLEIKADVPERALTADKVTLSVDSLTRRFSPSVSITSIPGSSFPAQIKEMATVANPATRTFEVTFSFEPEGNIRILPGMTARVTVEQPVDDDSSDQGFMIPSNATAIDDQGRPFVWRIDSSSMQAEAVVVALGAVTSADVTIYGDLSDGDLIALSGVHQLREGLQVQRLSEEN